MCECVQVCVCLCREVCVRRCDSRWGLKPVGIIINARAKSFVRVTCKLSVCGCVCWFVCVFAGVRASVCVLSDMCQNWKTTRICVKYPCQQRVSSATRVREACEAQWGVSCMEKDKYLKLEIVGMSAQSGVTCFPFTPPPPFPTVRVWFKCVAHTDKTHDAEIVATLWDRKLKSSLDFRIRWEQGGIYY